MPYSARTCGGGGPGGGPGGFFPGGKRGMHSTFPNPTPEDDRVPLLKYKLKKNYICRKVRLESCLINLMCRILEQTNFTQTKRSSLV